MVPGKLLAITLARAYLGSSYGGKSMIGNIFRFVTFLAISFSALAGAETKNVRWTGAEDTDGSLAHVINVLNQKTGYGFKATDFRLIEEKPLATSHYVFYSQVGGGVPLKKKTLQIWRALDATGTLIQAEAFVDKPLSAETLRILSANVSLSSQSTMQIVRKLVRAHADDKSIRDVAWEDNWDNGALVRTVAITGKRGIHKFEISIRDRKVLSQRYNEFPQDDHRSAEYSVKAKIYPIYEEIEGGNNALLPRVDVDLRYLSSEVTQGNPDVFAPLKTVRYIDEKHDPVLGQTEEGRKLGFWSMTYLKGQARALSAKLPLQTNDLSKGPAVLDGRYASIHLEPNVPKAFKGLDFTPAVSSIFQPHWQKATDLEDTEELAVTNALRGKPLKTVNEAYDRQVRRLPNHDAASYINDGFDEVQMYWAINRLFESLQPMGFTDPELSTRPYRAYLFDPDVSMRDNAYYHDDTIHFTTYSGKHPNMARDNSTIWHEMGHGVQDRLMGDHYKFADTGGLNEGMADFVAQLVINDVTNTKPYPGKEKMRIINNTLFHVTNEVHDDGEAYGGAMNDLLEAAMAKWGRPGLTKVTDLTMETMRLARNHPAVTANVWFERMLFADQRGHSPVREPGELKELIVNSLGGRNYNVSGSKAVALYSVKNGEQEVVAGSPGSRQSPIKLELKAAEKRTFTLNLSVKSGDTFKYEYPLRVKVQWRGGPLQGAIAWENKAQEPFFYEIKNEGDVLPVTLSVRGACDEFNRDDKSCVDFAYVHIFNRGNDKKPVAKKRFYLRIYPKE